VVDLNLLGIIIPCQVFAQIMAGQGEGNIITRVSLAVAAALAILISACSIANLGWLRNSPDVGRDFETLHVSSDYRYWYLYLENTPYAVTGC
jgi:hypothetical protein